MRIVRVLLLLGAVTYVAAFVGEHAGLIALASDGHVRDSDRARPLTPSPSIAARVDAPVTADARVIVDAHARRPQARAVAPPPLGRTLFVARFGRGDRLVTNDFAYYNPTNRKAIRSRYWLLTSGSLFAHDGAGWTGAPDSAAPNARSSNATGSATFRAVTRRRDFRNVAVSFDLKLERLITTRRNPAHSWDGVHVFLHYRSQHSLYVVSIARRDGVAIVKRKRPGGPANGGTYFTVGHPVRDKARFGRWERILVIIASRRSLVTIDFYLNGHLLLIAQDAGADGQPLAEPGAVGLRGDNAEFEFSHFRIRQLRR